MGESAGQWGDLAAYDADMAAQWDSYTRLPDPGENDALDAFLERKNLDHRSMLKLGARMAAPTTLAYGFATGLKMRDIESDKRWSYVGSDFTHLKIVRAGAEVSPDVLVTESETDAARLTMLYPSCDVALMPAGAKLFTKAMADQLSEYLRVAVATDNDVAGEAGAEKVMALLPQAVRHRPPGKDWGEYVGDTVPLPDPVDPAAVPNALEAKSVDLGELLRNGVPPVEYAPGSDAEGMVYDRGVWLLAGHPKTGKTSLVAHLAVDAMRAGAKAIYLDWENGAIETARRLAAVGAQHEMLSDRFIYVPFPGAPDWEVIYDLDQRHPGAVWIFDSTRGILRSLNLDEDKATDTSKFFDPLSRFALTNGVPTLVLDHVAKGATEAVGYSRGSGDKLAAVQAAYFVKLVAPFSETERGEIELHLWAARSGGLARKHRFAVGDGEGNLTFERLDVETERSVEAKIDGQIVEYLQRLHPKTASLSEIEREVDGKAATIRERAKALAGSPTEPVTTTQGSRHPRFVYVPEERKPEPPI